MTFTAVKLVRVQIFVSIGKAIAKKNADVRKICTPTTDRPTTDDRRPTDRPPATMIAIPLWAFSPRGKKGNALNSLII